MAETDIKEMFGRNFSNRLWFGRNFSSRSGHLLLLLVPHLFVFSIKRLEKFMRTKDDVMVETRNAKTEANLMDLPKDVMLEILVRLPVKSLCRFECVSKTSLNIIDSPSFAALHTPRLVNSFGNNSAAAEVEVPQLMLLAESVTWGYDHKIMALQLQLSKYSGKYGLRKTKHALLVTKFPNSYSECSVFCNLFLFKREWENGGPFFLLNPLREEVIKLPSSNDEVANFIEEKIIAEWYGIGFDDTTNTYKIVRVFQKAPRSQHLMVAQVYVLGTSSWREIDSVPPCELSSNKTSAYGDMHWFVYGDGGNPNRHIVSFDFKKEEFHWTPHPNIQFSRYPTVVHLINLRECLAIVDLSSYGDCIDIWLLKNRREWVLDYKIDGHKFVAKPRRHSIESCGAWEHGIFFKEENDRVYFLDLRHDSIKVENLPALPPGFFNPRIFSYTGSLISLKRYGNLVEGENLGIWQNFRNLIEEPRTGTWNLD